MGFDIVGPKYHKSVVPTELARKVVPEIFARCIAGDSLRTIAAWLDAEGIPTPRGGERWNESTVRWIIKRRAYAGRLQTRKGETVAQCEAIVPTSVFDEANSALKARPHRGPANPNRPMLAKLKCTRCGNPMYRVRAGTTVTHYYYRCFGSGAQRKGCGNLVPYQQTEVIIAILIFLTSKAPHRIRTWIEGTNYDAEISDVKQDIREAADAERWDELPALQAKLKDYRSRETVPGHYEYQETGQTVGEHFYSLDLDGRREYLAKEHDIRVEKAITINEGLPGVRVVIDGEDHGTFAYPPKVAL